MRSRAMASTPMPRARSTAEPAEPLTDDAPTARPGPDRAVRREAWATLAAALWLAWPYWRPDRYVAGFDTAAYSGPNLRVTLDAWGAGRIPWWNDRIFGGVAHLGNTQTGALYPLRVLAAPFSVNRGLNLLIAVHLVLFVTGMWWLARRLALRPPAGFVAAFVAGAGGAAMVKTIQFEQYLVLAWVPVVLVAVHAVVTGGRPWRAAAGLAACGSAALLAGHPQITYLAGCLAVVWGGGLLVASRAWRRALPLAVAGALMVLTCALQLLATVAAARASAVSGSRVLRDLALPERAVSPNLLVHVLLGTVRDIAPDAFAGSFESIGHVGVAAVLLAAIGLTAAFADPLRRAVAVTLFLGAFGATVLALGSRTVFYRGAYRLVPGFDLARVPARWLGVTAICLALLAGFGVDALVRRAAGRRELAAAGAVAAGIVLVLVLGLADVNFGRRTAAAWVLVGALAAAAIAATRWGVPRLPARAGGLLVAAVVALELGTGWLRGAAIRPGYDEPFDAATTPTSTFLAGETGWAVAFTDDGFEDAAQLVTGLRPNGNVLVDVPSLDGYDGGVQVTTRWLTLVERDHDAPNFELPLRNQLALPLDTEELARMYVRWVLIDNTRDAGGHVPGFLGPVLTDDRASVYENPAWRSEATQWFAAVAEPSPTAAARLLRDDLSAFRDTAVTGEELALPACATDCSPVPLELDRLSPSHVRVTTGAAAASFVSVAGQYDEGWSVTIDGEPGTTTSLDGVFLGAAVPAGAHVVDFRYEPGWALPGLLLSGLGVLATAGLALGEARYHRRRGARHVVHHG